MPRLNKNQKRGKKMAAAMAFKFGTPYHWRARFQYAPYMTYDIWLSTGPNGVNETDFRTAAARGVHPR